MSDRETFSFSRMTTFEQCARRYRYRYVDGVRDAFQSIEAFMGQQAHAALEWMFQERVQGRSPSDGAAVEFYTASFDKARTELGATLKVIKSDGKVEDYRRSGAGMVADFHRTRFLPDRMDTVGLEHHFVLDLGEGRKFQGFIDRLARDESGLLHVIDYKTGGRPPFRFAGKDADQLQAYAVAMFDGTSADQLRLTLEYLKGGATCHQDIRREETVETRRRLAERVRTAAEATVFPTGPGVLCGWCGFNDLCEDARPFGRR